MVSAVCTCQRVQRKLMGFLKNHLAREDKAYQR
jgi:hypothetical protein